MSAISSEQRELDSSKNEIRLLVLQPSMNRKSQIKCTRETVSLNDNPKFEALSYTWGDPNLVEPILVDHKAFKVTINASSALKALRHAFKPCRLWVDAICIDQSNLFERTAQVKMMGTIYQKASTVRVWLGPDDSLDAHAISILKSMQSVKGVEATIGYGDLASGRMKQVEHFFARSWWERLWVVQEVALGQNVVFQQGANKIKWNELIAANRMSVSVFNKSLKGANYGNYGSGGYKFMDTFESVHVLSQTRDLCRVDKHEKTSITERTMTWMTIADLLRSRKATVERDRLYALFGLLPLNVLESPSMTPLYSGTTEEAFTEATYGIIEFSKSFMMFNFLRRNSNSQASSSLPSWVPDWRLKPANKFEGNLRTKRESLFDASNGTPFYLRRLSSNTICLKGFFVDIVKEWQMTPIVTTTSIFLDACYNSWRELWANTHPDNAMLQKYVVDGTSAETAFRRTMVWDCAPGLEDGTLNRLIQAEGLAMFEAHDLAVKIGYGDDSDVMGDNLNALDARRTDYMISCARDRTFFVSGLGLIGMTQSNVKEGDHIFIVAGSSHPIILRPSKRFADTWHAVAECYLHSFMDGYAVQNMEACSRWEQIMSKEPALKAMKGTQPSPIRNLVTEESGGLWKWLLVE